MKPLRIPHSALLTLAAALAAICPVSSAQADDAATNAAPVAVTTNADGTTNSWTMADLVTALQLMNRKYHRDVATEAGRVSWHGRLVSQEVDTDALVKVSTYADGTEFRDPWQKVTASSAAAAKAAALSVTTNGIPARLAAARLRRATEKAAQSNVTVIVQAKIEAEQFQARFQAAAEEARAIRLAQEEVPSAECLVTGASDDASVGRDVPDAPTSDALH